ncbi:MAG TPA: hypothetical protein H9786_06190 [Candidatus Brachybacterium merdavium]|uniref:Uncharacterized protein n=1 Tax=Candidatus Brachybacterium merdavium TaxID=2838513 RepID=A0A9D2LCL5_9MICO|nr:hypothetical protein [Candidatus Brachybacterium merdavium]
MTASLRAVREIWADRTEARTRGDLLYLLYVAVLSVPVLVVPLLRMLGMGLARPDVLPVLLAGSAPQVVGAALPLAGAVALLVGAMRGPALLAPFFTASLAWSHLRRRTVLWRPFTRALTVPVLGGVISATLVTVTLVGSGHAGPAAGAWFVLAGLGGSLLLGSAWLLGQKLEAGPRRLLVLALTASAAVAAWQPVPLLLGAVYPADPAATSVPWAIGMLLGGAVAVGACIPMLDRLRGTVLAEQASRWESATVIATTGDLAGVAGQFRDRPTAARRLPAIGPGALPLLYARRDAVAWLRTPERSVVNALLVICAAAALAGGMQLAGPLAWLVIGAGTLGLWAGSGAFVDGIHHAIHTLGAPPLLGQSAALQAVLHALAPTLLLGALATLGAAGAALFTGSPGADAAVVLLVPVLLVPVLVAGRVRDAAKGPMPLSLATPMPTAQGDLSVIPMLIWQSDAIVLALLSGAALTLAGAAGTSWVLLAAAGAGVVMALMARSRLRGMRE